MRFIIGEKAVDYLDRVFYRGTIGLFYDSIWSGLLAYLIFAVVIVLAIIGLFTVIKWLLFRKKARKQ